MAALRGLAWSHYTGMGGISMAWVPLGDIIELTSKRSLLDWIPDLQWNWTLHCNDVINPRRACAARVTVLPLILALQGPSRLISDTNGSSATRARKFMWRFCLNGGVREIWR